MSARVIMPVDREEVEILRACIKVLEERVAELEEVTHRMKYPRLKRRVANEGGR